MITNSYRISARVTQQLADARTIAGLAISESDEKIRSGFPGKYKDLPIIYIVKVQIRIAGLWVTTWKESCDASDDSIRAMILERANALFKKMEAAL